MKKLLFFVALAFIAFAFTNHAGYHIGDTAQDFKLKNTDGKMVSMADYKDAKGYIVIFSCNHCPFAKAYEDRIIDLDKKYKKAGYPVIVINPNDPEIQPEDSYKNMQKRAKEKKYTFPYLIDETQAVARTFGATRTPHVFVLDKVNNELKVAYIGAIDNNSENAGAVTEKYVESAIDALQNDKPVSPAMTKAIGCTIKWKK